MEKQWPGDARCVVALTVDFDGTANELGLGHEPVGIHSAGGYSARRGVSRMIEMFARHRISVTFFVPGYDAETNPETIRRIAVAGHEVAAHGYLHERWDVPPDEEETLLRRTHNILTDIVGQPPRGWRSPGGKKSDRTLAILRDLGYIYDSSDKDYDGPYPAIVAGAPSREMVELPNNTAILDDWYLYAEAAATPQEVLMLWQAQFEAAYRTTGYFVVTCHPRAGFGSGIPSRARVIDRLINYIKGFPNIQFVRLADLAEWCLDPSHGFMDTTLWIGARA